MVRLDDLSKEDRAKLLAEARSVIEEENIEANAKAMYAIKKKGLVEGIEEEIRVKLGYPKTGPDFRKFNQKYISMLHVLYKKCTGSYDSMPSISTPEQWDIFQNCATKLRDAIFDIYDSARK